MNEMKFEDKIDRRSWFEGKVCTKFLKDLIENGENFEEGALDEWGIKRSKYINIFRLIERGHVFEYPIMCYDEETGWGFVDGRHRALASFWFRSHIPVRFYKANKKQYEKDFGKLD